MIGQTMSAIRKAILLCSILLVFPHAHALQIEPKDWDGYEFFDGGHSILVEEKTATDCVACAEIDPDLSLVAEEHGTRIAMVAYHPMDVNDAFQLEAGQHRIDRLSIQHSSLGPTPAFVVNNGEVREGVPSWPDVQGDILRSESNQRQYTKLRVTAESNSTHLTVTVMPPKVDEVVNDTQFTILFVEHKKMVDKAFDNPGEPHRDRVLVGLAEFATAGTHMLAINATIEAPYVASINHENVDEWSVIVVHEFTEERLSNNSFEDTKPLGVVELSVRSPVAEAGVELPLILPVLIFLSIGILGLVTVNLKEKVSEEE